MTRRAAALATTAALVAAGLAACGETRGAGDGSETTLTVFAAASLTAPFSEIGRQFEAKHDGVRVTFSFAGSADLVAQVQQGAPADVLASADERTMDAVVDEGLVEGPPRLFASNELAIVTAPGNPEGVQGLEDLADDDLVVVVCAPQVPCGAATARAQEAAGVEVAAASEESAVTDVLAKVTSGEAGAGLVYATDAAAAGDAVTTVEFPEAAEAITRYPVAVLSGTEHDDLAQAFVDHVLGKAGQRVLADAGFGRP